MSKLNKNIKVTQMDSRETKKKEISNLETPISRKEAVKKFGKFIAFTALGTFVLLNPQQAQASSPGAPGPGF